MFFDVRGRVRTTFLTFLTTIPSRKPTLRIKSTANAVDSTLLPDAWENNPVPQTFEIPTHFPHSWLQTAFFKILLIFDLDALTHGGCGRLWQHTVFVLKSVCFVKTGLVSLSVAKQYWSATTLENFFPRHRAGRVCTVPFGKMFLCTLVKKVSAFGFRNYSWRLGLGDKSKVSDLK